MVRFFNEELLYTDAASHSCRSELGSFQVEASREPVHQ